MWEVFNMGCGFAVVVPEADEAAAVELLARHHPGTRRIGTITAEPDRITVPPLGIAGGPDGLALWRLVLLVVGVVRVGGRAVLGDDGL